MNYAFICDYARPIGRFGGSLSTVRADDLGAVPIKALIERNRAMDPAAIDEVYYGCANQAGEDNRNVARMSLLLAGLPASVPATTINRLCGSGRIMGIGPVPATVKLCARLGLTPKDFDLIELNEAFASQGIAVLRQLGIDEAADHVNVNGGAIALGHPLGMSGARITGTVALEARDRGAARMQATMCIGVGQGIALALEAA